MSPEEHNAFLQQPAAPAPPGAVPNFAHPKNQFGYAFPLYLVVFVISNMFFFMKIFTQLRIAKKFRVEDYLLGVGWLVYAGAFFPTGALVCYLPVGVHQWEMTQERYQRNMFVYSLTFPVYGIVMIFVKSNILLQYARIFVPTGLRNFTWWASHVLIWLNVLFYVIYTFLCIFICSPRAKFWDSTIDKGKCLDWIAILATGNAVTLLSDVIILLLPQRVIFNLHLSRSRKIGMSLLFIIGIFACFASAIRLNYHVKLIKDRSDITYLLSKICFWATCQLTAGFLVACLPALPALWKHVRQKPWAVRVGSSVRSLLHISKNESQGISNEKITTIGGGKNRHQVQIRQATDLEFEELVNKTDVSSISSITHSRLDTPRSGDDVV